MRFIISPFNAVFFGLLATIILLAVVLTLLLKNKSMRTKKIVLLCIGIFNLVLWVVYKIWLFQGVEEIKDIYTFQLSRELPLHLCNISLFLFIIGVIFQNDFCNAYCSFVAGIGALMALIAPSPGFFDNSLFSLHNVGYYFTHAIIILNAILLISLGFFKPSIKSAVKSIVATICLAFVLHCVNSFIVYFLHEEADYFYTMHLTDISLLNFFWNLIPVQFFYLLPPFLLYGLVLFLIVLPFELIGKKKNAIA